MQRILIPIAIMVLIWGSPAASSQSTGPDLIIGSIPDVASFGQSNGISAFALGTNPCNIGTAPAAYVSFTNNHPVAAQNLYRFRDGRFEQIGMSWLKHSFAAGGGSLCQTCQPSGTSTMLGVGCSGAYVATLNGSQSSLGPPSDVNPTTGLFPYPFSNPSIPPTIGRRIQVANSDFDPITNAGATYIAECHIVSSDDAAAGNKNNNASYRRIDVTGTGPYTLSFSSGSTTVREKAAIYAWESLDPAVQLKEIDIQDGTAFGRVVVGFRATKVSPTLWDWEFAVYNMNSHRAVSSVQVAYPTGAIISNVGFKDVAHHSGDGAVSGTNYDGTDWSSSVGPATVTWSTPDFTVAPNGNALRWGTTYNFRFQSSQPPASTFSVDLGIYRPGTPTTVSTTFDPPTDVTALSGADQAVNIGESFPQPFRVAVTDVFGVPMVGVPVAFIVESGSVTLSTSTATTDAAGEAEVFMTAGLIPGPTTVRADVGGSGVLIQNFVRKLEMSLNSFSTILATTWRMESPNLPLIAVWDVASVAPTPSPWGTIYTSVLAPQPPAFILDGTGIIYGTSDPTTRTSAVGVYSKILFVPLTIVGTGIQIVSQCYAAPGYPVVSNPAYITL